MSIDVGQVLAVIVPAAVLGIIAWYVRGVRESIKEIANDLKTHISEDTKKHEDINSRLGKAMVRIVRLETQLEVDGQDETRGS